MTGVDVAAMHPMQRVAFEGIVAPYLDGRQDGEEWALIDNTRADHLRYALQALILVHLDALEKAIADLDDMRQMHPPKSLDRKLASLRHWLDAALTDPRLPSATPTAETVPPRVAGTGGPQNPAQSRGSGE